jgi:hypothetical protein
MVTAIIKSKTGSSPTCLLPIISVMKKRSGIIVIILRDTVR